jgi:hypothetical protein
MKVFVDQEASLDLPFAEARERLIGLAQGSWIKAASREASDLVHRNLNYNITSSVVPDIRFSGPALAASCRLSGKVSTTWMK